MAFMNEKGLPMVARREEQVISLLFLYICFEFQENKRKGLPLEIFVFLFSIDCVCKKLQKRIPSAL